ncbi:MAG: 30S ribosomal protein S2, partial [Lactobacillus sp.]|nr:30S ribosomal protein S2 [Lactobacillus sp.]
YGKKDNVHIIDLQQTYPLFYTALNAAKEIAASGGKVLFVGTKRQAQDLVKENAERCGQYYVNYRWLGGMMTNWKTVYKSITRLNKLNTMFETNEIGGYTKKELLQLKKEQDKLSRELSGIANMGGQPDLLFVVDTTKEMLAIKEAKKLGIPVIGIVDTNADPEVIDFPVPGNDDAIRAIQFYCESLSAAVIDGMKAEIAAQGLKVEEMVEKSESKTKKIVKKAEDKVEEIKETAVEAKEEAAEPKAKKAAAPKEEKAETKTTAKKAAAPKTAAKEKAETKTAAKAPAKKTATTKKTAAK